MCFMPSLSRRYYLNFKVYLDSPTSLYTYFTFGQLHTSKPHPCEQGNSVILIDPVTENLNGDFQALKITLPLLSR